MFVSFINKKLKNTVNIVRLADVDIYSEQNLQDFS